MKRLAWLLIIGILSFNTVGFTRSGLIPSSFSSSGTTSPALARAPWMDLSMPGDNSVCEKTRAARACASVSNGRPAPKTYVTVYGALRIRGEPQQGEPMKATLRFKGSSASCTGMTDSNGLASCSIYFAGGSGGRRVGVKVRVGQYTIDTYFSAH